jgi:hypothetical protein
MFNTWVLCRHSRPIYDLECDIKVTQNSDAKILGVRAANSKINLPVATLGHCYVRYRTAIG